MIQSLWSADLEGYLEARLQQDRRELWMHFRRHPETEVFVWVQTLDHLQHITVQQVQNNIYHVPSNAVCNIPGAAIYNVLTSDI